jgi:hypothetical protein
MSECRISFCRTAMAGPTVSRAANSCLENVQNRIERDEVFQPLVAHDLQAFFPDPLPHLEFTRPNRVAREVSFVKAHEFRLGHVPELFAFGLRDVVFLHPGRDISRGYLPVHPPAHPPRRRSAATRPCGVAIVRKRLGLATSLYPPLQILSVTLFEKTPILCALPAPEADAEFAENVNQLILFDI